MKTRINAHEGAAGELKRWRTTLRSWAAQGHYFVRAGELVGVGGNAVVLDVEPFEHVPENAERVHRALVELDQGYTAVSVDDLRAASPRHGFDEALAWLVRHGYATRSGQRVETFPAGRLLGDQIERASDGIRANVKAEGLVRAMNDGSVTVEQWTPPPPRGPMLSPPAA